MSNDKDFKVKNGIQPAVYQEGLGTIATGSVTVGYDISVAAYDSVSFSVSGQETNPFSLNFNNDGTKMYVIGSVSDRVHQYSLSTAFDLSTASYDSVSFSVSSQDTDPSGIAFNNDGTKMYVIGYGSGSVHQYSLTTAYDLSTASYDNVSFSVSSQDTVPFEIAFNNDGTKMYIVGINNDNVYQYSLSTAFDLSTASYDSVSFSVAGQDTDPSGIAFNNEGTKMYLVGWTNNNVHQYTLSTAFDLSTASYDSISFSVAGQDTTSRSLAFNNDGTKMYILGDSTNTIFQYSTGSTLTTNTLDLSTGNAFQITPTSNIQVGLSNPAASGTVSQGTLLLKAVGTAYTITYDSTIQFGGGTAPDSPLANETDVLTFSTRDGGTTYQAAQAIDGAV